MDTVLLVLLISISVIDALFALILTFKFNELDLFMKIWYILGFVLIVVVVFIFNAWIIFTPVFIFTTLTVLMVGMVDNIKLKK